MDKPSEYVPTAADRAATQYTGIFGVCVQFCGRTMTPDAVDELRDQLMAEITTGPTSWAFKDGK